LENKRPPLRGPFQKMDKTLEEVKLILEKRDFDKDYLALESLPQEEAKIFLAAVNNLDQYLTKLDSPILDKESAKRWSLIYLAIHDLLHSETQHQDIVKLEVFSTAPIFDLTKNILTEEDFGKLSLAYFLLGISSLKIDHSLEYLISEKLILGEFVALGGLEAGIWGIKFKHQFLSEAAKNVFDKVKNDRYKFLLKKYKNLVFDFYNLNQTKNIKTRIKTKPPKI
jgi:hypothetical protein